jgi:hypothetical protein
LTDFDLVVDFTSGIGGAYRTKLFADADVEVIQVEQPEGAWLRTWSASAADIRPGSDGAP